MAKPNHAVRPPLLSTHLTTVEDGDVTLDDDAEWTEIEVSGDHSGAVACDVDLHDVRLTRARFTGAELQRARLTDVVIEDCDLSGAMLESIDLHRVVLRDCRMSGVVFTRARLRDVRFERCRLDGASFRMSEAERALFEDSMMVGADLYSAKFPDVRFFGCDLRGADFSAAALKGARFHGSTLEGIKGGRALAGIVIDSTQLVPVSHVVLASLNITVDDDAEPEAR
jgi:uncharacterized protein YjbI with pentapeptide repeats